MIFVAIATVMSIIPPISARFCESTWMLMSQILLSRVSIIVSRKSVMNISNAVALNARTVITRIEMDMER